MLVGAVVETVVGSLEEDGDGEARAALVDFSTSFSSSVSSSMIKTCLLLEAFETVFPFEMQLAHAHLPEIDETLFMNNKD